MLALKKPFRLVDRTFLIANIIVSRTNSMRWTRFYFVSINDYCAFSSEICLYFMFILWIGYISEQQRAAWTVKRYFSLCNKVWHKKTMCGLAKHIFSWVIHFLYRQANHTKLIIVNLLIWCICSVTIPFKLCVAFLSGGIKLKYLFMNFWQKTMYLCCWFIEINWNINF